jgi:hypothetical protein
MRTFTTALTTALAGGLALASPAPTNADSPPPTPIVAELTGFDNAGNTDRLTVEAPVMADLARVNLLMVVRGAEGRERILVATGELSRYGIARFAVPDANGRQRTRYVARVRRTDDTGPARTDVHAVR